MVFFFDCPENLARERVVTRKEGREGDNLQAFEKRYKEFSALNPPILKYFQDQNKILVVGISSYRLSCVFDMIDTDLISGTTHPCASEQIDTSGELPVSLHKLHETLAASYPELWRRLSEHGKEQRVE